MKQLVKINAQGVDSKYGYIVEEFGDAALIKVGCSSDWNGCLLSDNCIILGSDLYEKI